MTVPRPRPRPRTDRVVAQNTIFVYCPDCMCLHERRLTHRRQKTTQAAYYLESAVNCPRTLRALTYVVTVIPRNPEEELP